MNIEDRSEEYKQGMIDYINGVFLGEHTTSDYLFGWIDAREEERFAMESDHS